MMEHRLTLDFCKECQALLPPYNGLTCPQCDAPVVARDQRLQGTFSEKEARAMLRGNGYVDC